MEWQIIVALVIAIPVILLPVMFVWYVNAGGMFSEVKEIIKKRVMYKKLARENARVK